MTPWTFTLPTKVQFGPGVAKTLHAVTSEYGDAPIVVTDRSLSGQPWFRELIAALGTVALFDGVQPNPTVECVDALARVVRGSRRDVIVAIGGGSAIDCAKAASVLALPGDESIRAYHTGGRTIGPDHLPVIAVPTTAGTGSEVTPFAVLDDPASSIKAPIASSSLYPTLALVDPELTLSLPRFTTAATAMDALTHAIEGFWSRNHQPICDLLAQEAARLVLANFEAVCETPREIEPRTAMAYAALLAGMAFQLPKNAMVHACSYPLSNRFHLAHGVACAFTLEFAIRFNAPALGARFNAFVEGCGFSSADALAERVHELKRLGGLPCTLEEAGIPQDAIDSLVQESFHPLMNNNPRPVRSEDLDELYATLA